MIWSFRQDGGEGKNPFGFQNAELFSFQKGRIPTGFPQQTGEMTPIPYTTMMHIRAFLFDLDETLLRGSLQAHRKAWDVAIHEWLSRQRMLKSGQSLSLPDMDFFYAHEGQSSPIITALLLEELQIPYNQQVVDHIVERKTTLTQELYAPTLAPHAREVIKALKHRQKRLAVVTGASRQVAVAVIERMFGKPFDVIISGNDVTQGKPHPEPYQQAVERLTVPHAQCVAVENAPFGIDSAKAAGIFTVAVPFTLPPERLQKADLIVTDLRELLEL